MEEDKNIDDLFRQTIESHQIDPPEHVWNSLDEKLSARRTPKRDRKILRLWISSIAALLVITAGSYLYLTDDLISPGAGDGKITGGNASQTVMPEDQSDTKQLTSPSATATTAPGEQAGGETGSSNQSRGGNSIAESAEVSEASDPVRHSNTPSAGIDKKEKGTPVLAAGNTKQNPTAGATAPSVDGKAASAEPGGSAGGNNNKDVDAAGLTIAVATVPAGSEQPVSKDLSESSKTPESGSDEGSNRELTPAAVIVTAETGASKEVEGKEKGIQEETLAVIPAASPAGQETRKPTEDMANVQAAAPEAQDGKTAVLADSVPDYNKDKSSEINSAKPGSRFTVEMYYSPDLAFRTIAENEDYSGPGASDGLSIYSREESNYTYSTGIRLLGTISEKWSVATGGFFSTFSQTSGLNTVYVVSETTFQNNYGSNQPGYNQGPWGSQYLVTHTSCGAINLQNQPYYMHGSGECYYPEIGDTLNLNIQSTERIQFISIPLTVRYYLGKQRMAYYAEAGAAINFIVDKSVTSTVNNSYSETNDIVGMKSINYSVLFSVGMQYSLEHKWNLFAEPNLRYSVTPINENNPVLSYPYFLGLKMGVGYSF